jgi:hypothetical protein
MSNFPSDMPWYFKAIQSVIDFVGGIFGKNPDDPKDYKGDE